MFSAGDEFCFWFFAVIFSVVVSMLAACQLLDAH